MPSRWGASSGSFGYRFSTEATVFSVERGSALTESIVSKMSRVVGKSLSVTKVRKILVVGSRNHLARDKEEKDSVGAPK